MRVFQPKSLLFSTSLKLPLLPVSIFRLPPTAVRRKSSVYPVTVLMFEKAPQTIALLPKNTLFAFYTNTNLAKLSSFEASDGCSSGQI